MVTHARTEWARTIGFLSQPELMVAKIYELETAVEEIKANLSKMRPVLEAAREHKKDHYRKQHRHCNCGICSAMAEMEG